MENKEFYKSLNGLEYSDEEIFEYENIGNFSFEELSRISGAVKIKYGIEQIRKLSNNVYNLLDEGEMVEKVVKTRDIVGITIITLLGGTTFKSNDFGVFNTLFFTNKRVFYGFSNYLNENLTSGWIENDNILGIKFTNKRVKVIKEKDNENKDSYKIKLSRWTPETIFSEVWLLASIIGAIMQAGEPRYNRILLSLFLSIGLKLVLTFQHKYLDKFNIILKEGSNLQCLIASDDYFKCKAYLVKIANRYKSNGN